MAKITTGSQVDKHSFRDFFSLGWAEVFLYILISTVIIIVLNAGSIINKLSNNYIGSPEKLSANFSTLETNFNKSFSSALGGRLGQIILWACIGAFAYLILWLARNVLTSFENDIISDHYLHPSTYSRAGYWGSSLSIKIFLAALIIITGTYILFIIKTVVLALAALAGSAAYNFHGLTSVVYIISPIVALAVALYIAVVLLRLIIHLWKAL